MSTKAIRAALSELKARREDCGSSDGEDFNAMQEVEAIERLPAVLQEMVRTDWRNLPTENEALVYFLIREMERRLGATLRTGDGP